MDEAVTFEGAVPDSMHAIAAGHVVALSSISEGLPFTVIEAMMAGRATVNTDVGGVAEVVGTDGEAGLLVHPRDPRQLADGIIALLQDPDRRQAMGRKARARALELFSLTTFVDRYRDLYEMALNDVAVSEPVQMKRLVTAEAEDQNNSQAGGVA